jgi:hypothetical protein
MMLLLCRLIGYITICCRLPYSLVAVFSVILLSSPLNCERESTHRRGHACMEDLQAYTGNKVLLPNCNAMDGT